MILNKTVYGEPTPMQSGMIFNVVGNGTLENLINTGKITLNTLFDQSIIACSTTAPYFSNWVGIDNTNILEPTFQQFKATTPVGVIWGLSNPVNANAANLYYESYSSRDNAYIVYNGTGFGMKSYGHNPYGEGEYKFRINFVTGYKWDSLRWVVYVKAANTILAQQQESVQKINSNAVTGTWIELQKYIDNVDNVRTGYPVIIGARIEPVIATTGRSPTINNMFYSTVNLSTNTLKTISDVTNDVFFINQGTYCIMGDQYFRGSGYGIPLIMGGDDTLFEISKLTFGGESTSSRRYSIYYPRYRGANPQQLVQAFAYLGIPVTTSVEHATKDAITGGTIYAMNIDDTGKTDGNLVSGNDISNIRQSNFTDDILTDNGFNGIDNVDPNNYTDKIDLNKPTLSTTNIFNRTFALNANNVKSLADFLWNADETKFDEIIKGLGLMGENPIDGLIDLRMYPFDVAAKNSSTAAESIVVGRTDTGVNGIKITENANAIIDLGSCSFFQKFKNFLDYEPYTTAQLYIPYVGVVPVSTAEFMGHNISCKMIVDFVTGGCTAVVYKDDIPYIYRNGTMAVEVPMTATNSARMAQTALNNVIGAVMDTGKTIGALGNGDIGGAITGGISALSNVYSAASIPTQYQTAGASTANCATWQPQNCYFIIDRPITQIPNNYGHTVGYACEQTGTLNSFSGFTVIANPDINFKCTDTEKTMLINALQGGVYV